MNGAFYLPPNQRRYKLICSCSFPAYLKLTYIIEWIKYLPTKVDCISLQQCVLFENETTDSELSFGFDFALRTETVSYNDRHRNFDIS